MTLQTVPAPLAVATVPVPVPSHIPKPRAGLPQTAGTSSVPASSGYVRWPMSLDDVIHAGPGDLVFKPRNQWHILERRR